jgi:hypothetical protein
MWCASERYTKLVRNWTPPVAFICKRAYRRVRALGYELGMNALAKRSTRRPSHAGDSNHAVSATR